MHQIFAEAGTVPGEEYRVTGDEAHHIRDVLRMKPGEELIVRTGDDSREYRYGIDRFEQDADTQNAIVVLRLRFVRESDTELPVKVRLYQCLPKADKMELIVQKAVELGACEIIPVESARCIVKLDAGKKEKKTARWQAIADSAASQCGRGVLPKVQLPMPIEKAFADAAENSDVCVIPYELQGPGQTRELLEAVKPGESISVFIGPEGGFEKSEIESAEKHGIIPISLGRRILRTETAGLAFLSFLIWLYEIE